MSWIVRYHDNAPPSHILTVAGVTVAICASPLVAASNMVALAVWPTWIAVAVTETIRKVISYVLTRPGRELLFTVVSLDEKYKAKVCIDVIVQRLVMRQLLEFIVCCSADLRRKQTWLPYMHCRYEISLM
jgi:AAA family ATP:ADP antiporter